MKNTETTKILSFRILISECHGHSFCQIISCTAYIKNTFKTNGTVLSFVKLKSLTKTQQIHKNIIGAHEITSADGYSHSVIHLA